MQNQCSKERWPENQLEDEVFIGMVSIDNKVNEPRHEGIEARKPEPLDNKNFMRFEEIAWYLSSILIENRREELIKEQAMQLEMLRKMDDELSKPLSLQSALETILKYAVKLAGVPWAHIRHYENGKLVKKAMEGDYPIEVQSLRLIPKNQKLLQIRQMIHIIVVGLKDLKGMGIGVRLRSLKK
jgi:hypothetical protein